MSRVIESQPHRLEVHDHPLDGWTVLHPPSCPSEMRDLWADPETGQVLYWIQYGCNVEIYQEHVGLADIIAHAFDDWDGVQAVLPGMYTLHHELELRQGFYDGYPTGYYEPEDYVTVEPQRAITTGLERGSEPRL